MIKANIGDLIIMINGQYFDYCAYEMPTMGKQFKVDGRYRILIDNIPLNEETVMDCILQSQHREHLIVLSEPGEDLALISFMFKNMKLSIGVEGDIPGVKYDYLNDRLRIRVSEYASISKLDVFIAWLTMNNIEKEEIYTWFAADPTIDQ